MEKADPDVALSVARRFMNMRGDQRIEVLQVDEVPANPALPDIDEHMRSAAAVHVGGQPAAVELRLAGQGGDELSAPFGDWGRKHGADHGDRSEQC